ncbi:MAG: hypothetical protein H8D34_08790, partial [Chloroflexi bacterium]|nr:hypothetical protein [Chloroflexota bacterium]
MSTQKHSKSNTFTRVVIGLLLSLLSGVMLTAAFAPYNMWPLVFVAFLPMIAAQYRVFPAKVSSLGGATMIGAWVFMYFGPTFFWGGFMLALPAVVFVINFFTEKGARKFHANTGYRWFIISGVTNWVGFEIARTFIPGIATWGFVNYTLWSQTWLIQPVSIFGIYGLSLLIMLINYALGQALLAWIDRRWTFDAAPQIPARFIRRWLVGVG